LVIARLVTITC